jgi:hypothetical protein
MLGFTAQQTLDYTQSLYEKKLCTYPRTDSRFLTADMEGMLPGMVEKMKEKFGFHGHLVVNPKQVINNKNFLEVDLGLSGWTGVGIIVTGVYNFVLANPTWTPGTWTWYAGAGATAGVGFTPKVDDANVKVPYAIVGLTGQMGLSYQFENYPIQLSADIRPTLGIQTYPLGFYGTGNILSAISPAISVRYAF